MTDKDKYRTLCRTEPSIPVFSQDWWLDTVCGAEKWNVLLQEKKGNIRAALPIYLPVPKIISMPPYTQTMGPWFGPEAGDAKYSTSLSQRRQTSKSFIPELKRYVAFMQNFNYSVTDWLPFYWEGFRQTTRYTYLLHNIKDADGLWNNMSLNTRRHIKKAQDKYRLTVKRGVPKNDFLRVNALTFARQKRKPPHAGVLERLIDACIARGQGDIWGGYDDRKRLHAAVFIVWQDSSAYYIAGGADPLLRDSGAQALVMWQAVRNVAEYTALFDFEGSMMPGVERFFREFGAVQTPYFSLSRGKVGLWNRLMIKLFAGDPLFGK
ncbi:MAG: GNAT family N-acetyltransferase [Tannerellaceae bacterium]|nr:GNAT family N-acetyltransferase [Tannerellaceae bacterium]